MSPLRTTIGMIVAAVAATLAFLPMLEAAGTEQRRIVVEIRKLAFDPQSVDVRVGDVVVWRNRDIVPHTATSIDDSWNSGMIEAGGERKTLVTETMIRDYFCKYHPSMVATLHIRTD